MLAFFLSYSQTKMYRFYYRRQIQGHPYTLAQILEKNMLVYYCSRLQWCPPDVSSNDGEASAGEADFSKILSGAFVHSAHQTRHQCRAGEEATKQIHRGEGGTCSGSWLWLALSGVCFLCRNTTGEYR